MRNLVSLLSILIGGLLSQPAAAEPKFPRVQLESPTQLRSASLSPREAAQRAERKYGGKALGVTADGAGYRVKLLQGGDVHTVYISP
jgi:hypothetical protein